MFRRWGRSGGCNPAGGELIAERSRSSVRAKAQCHIVLWGSPARSRPPGRLVRDPIKSRPARGGRGRGRPPHIHRHRLSGKLCGIELKLAPQGRHRFSERATGELPTAAHRHQAEPQTQRAPVPAAAPSGTTRSGHSEQGQFGGVEHQHRSAQPIDSAVPVEHDQAGEHRHRDVSPIGDRGRRDRSDHHIPRYPARVPVPAGCGSAQREYKRAGEVEGLSGTVRRSTSLPRE